MAERTRKGAGKVPASRGGSTPAAKKGAAKAPAKKNADKKAPAKKAPAKKAPDKKPADAKAPSAAKASPAGKSPAKSGAAKKSGGRTSVSELVVLPREKPWTDKEIADQRAALEAESQRLRTEIFDSEVEIADLVRAGADTAGDDQADTGSKTFEREHEMYLANSHREILSQTDRALSKIDDGTYGVCEKCGNPVGKARLQAFPRATLCMDCKQREERR